jgi:transposase, IS605 OrfB family, central region
MNRAYKFRIYPNKEQEVLFVKTFGCVRFIYNKMLEDKIAHYEQTKQSLKNTPAPYKKVFEWLKEVDSLALCNAQINLQAAFKNFFQRPEVGFPKFKSKHSSKASYTTNYINDNIKIDAGKIRLPKAGWVKVKQHRQIPANYILKAVTITRNCVGKYFASILFEYEQDVQPVSPVTCVGLDFSMKELYVSSDGEVPAYPRYYRVSLKRLAREQRKLSLCQKGSSNRNKQRIKVARHHEHVANQRKNFLHQLTRKIANFYDAVCVEDLNMKALSQCLNFGKSVSDNGWAMFLAQMSYKLTEAGKYLVKIDKWFPSSKMCSQCGSVKDDLPLSERTYSCDCGFESDRDLNAAINILNQGKLLLSNI